MYWKSGKIMKKSKFIKYAYEFIEQNTQLQKYHDIKLYEHQKQIFTACKSKEAKMICIRHQLVRKNTPVGLVSEERRQLKKNYIVCAAKHIGLQLAKSVFL